MNTNLVKKHLLGGAITASILFPVMASADTYTVKSGDTLSEIAEKYDTTVDKIAFDNQILDVNFIVTGQVLEISENTTKIADVDTRLTDLSTENTTSSSYTSHLTQSEAGAKEIIAQRESGGSYTAQNGQYYGRYQLTISYLNGDLSPENQEKVADAYVIGRYGSWAAALAFWNVNGWY